MHARGLRPDRRDAVCSKMVDPFGSRRPPGPLLRNGRGVGLEVAPRRLLFGLERRHRRVELCGRPAVRRAVVDDCFTFFIAFARNQPAVAVGNQPVARRPRGAPSSRFRRPIGHTVDVVVSPQKLFDRRHLGEARGHVGCRRFGV